MSIVPNNPDNTDPAGTENGYNQDTVLHLSAVYHQGFLPLPLDALDKD
jgi:hypothetical protein